MLYCKTVIEVNKTLFSLNSFHVAWASIRWHPLLFLGRPFLFNKITLPLRKYGNHWGIKCWWYIDEVENWREQLRTLCPFTNNLLNVYGLHQVQFQWISPQTTCSHPWKGTQFQKSNYCNRRAVCRSADEQMGSVVKGFSLRKYVIFVALRVTFSTNELPCYLFENISQY